MSRDYDEDDKFTLEDLTTEDWFTIKKIALKVYKSGQYGEDRTKCGIYAFVYWLGSQEKDFILDVDDVGIIKTEH